jgi:poly-beta-1,6-N-acetyl-D-glucosamine synthase
MAYEQIAMHSHGIPELLFYSITILYCSTFMAILYSWLHLRIPLPVKLIPMHSVSVVIAARNEECSLPLLLNDLEKQSYPAELTEIIIVDDHSSMKVEDLPSVKNSTIQKLSIVRLTDRQMGKKQALIKGVESSSSELILFTDADCRVGRDWVQSHMELYHRNMPDMIIGLVDYTSTKGLLQFFARLEQIALTISGAGSALIGHPTLCNGANLAIKRSIYLGFAGQLKMNTPSGDDLFLLHALKKRKNSSIAVLISLASVVKTVPPATIRQLVNQRARWASKAGRYSDRDTLLFALLVLITNLALLVAFLYCLYIPQKWSTFCAVLALKTIADCFLTTAGLYFFKGLWQVLLMPVFELFYPFHMIITLVVGFTKQYTWKERLARSLIESL